MAERLVRGAALAELLLAGNRRHRGLPAGAPWQSKGTVNAQAPMRSQLEGWPGRRGGARALPRVCGTEQALLWSEGADNAQASPRSTSG